MKTNKMIKRLSQISNALEADWTLCETCKPKAEIALDAIICAIAQITKMQWCENDLHDCSKNKFTPVE